MPIANTDLERTYAVRFKRTADGMPCPFNEINLANLVAHYPDGVVALTLATNRG